MTATADRLVSLKTGNSFTFEAETCSRCGGSGHYSYCQSHGTRCFKCGGHGITLTKRGAAAQEFYRSLLMVPAEQVEVGQLLHSEGIPGFTAGGFSKVTRIERKVEQITINGETIERDMVHLHAETTGLTAEVGSMVRIGHSAEAKADFRRQALEFEATLTKTGKPRKR